MVNSRSNQEIKFHEEIPMQEEQLIPLCPTLVIDELYRRETFAVPSVSSWHKSGVDLIIFSLRRKR
jgi:hypothetical protein